MNKVIQHGTTLTIDEAFRDSVVKARERGDISRRQLEEWNHRLLEYMPVTIKFGIQRVDRKTVYLSWRFLYDDKQCLDGYIDPYLRHCHFDLTLFSILDYKIIRPQQIELDLMLATKDILSPKELALREFIQMNACHNKPRRWSEDMFKMVEEAMSRVGVVFYVP